MADSAIVEAMSERETIEISTKGPVTKEWLLRDLKLLGVEEGMNIMFHVSLSKLGWVLGGSETVIHAVLAAVGEGGTIAMPTFTSGNTDPSNWQAPPVPKEWWPVIREQMPAFDSKTSPARAMGQVGEFFRTMPNVIRSNHPTASWAALGPKAQTVTKHEEISCGYGRKSPCQHFYDLKGHVLSLGTDKTTILHYAEVLADFAGKSFVDEGTATIVDGKRQWVKYKTLDWCDDDFALIRADYIKDGKPHTRGTVAYGEATLFPICELVDYAVAWMERNRR